MDVKKEDCGHFCWNHPLIGLIPECGCPIHDKNTEEGQMAEKDNEEVKVGIESYLQPKDGRPDLFIAEEYLFHFPCGECKNKLGGTEYCGQCRHFVF